ncbi:MAG: EcsC family protein [Burkholderiales bacterium]
MPIKNLPVSRFETRVTRKVAEAILNFVGKIPTTTKHRAHDPAVAARNLARAAATKAAVTSGSLALPPGPLGMLTLIPDLVAVWKIQAQLVADIAAVYGQKAQLTKEQMLYCLFRHFASQAVRDLVVRAGERVLIRSASLQLLQTIAQKIGINVTKKFIGKSISRWIPVVGALGVGAYAYFDTGQVAATAIELFEREIQIESQ